MTEAQAARENAAYFEALLKGKERALRVLLRLEKFSRHSARPQEQALAREACEILVNLEPGAIDYLAEPRRGNKASDRGVS